MLRDLAKRCLRSSASVIAVSAPRGFGKSTFVEAVIASESAAFSVDLGLCNGADAVDRAMIEALVFRSFTGRGNAAQRRHILIIEHVDAVLESGAEPTLARWIRNLVPMVRVMLVSRRKPTPLLAALGELQTVRVSGSDLAFPVAREELGKRGFAEADIARLLAQYGRWPAAWKLIINRTGQPKLVVDAEEQAHLEDMVDAEFQSLDAPSRLAALALSVLGEASAHEIGGLAGIDTPDAALDELDGFVERRAPDRYAMPFFFRRRAYVRYPEETARLAAVVVNVVARDDPFRALTIAVEREDTAAVRAILDALAPAEQERLMALASDVIDAARFLGDDDLFLQWWQTPRSREQSSCVLERLEQMRAPAAAAVRARRDLAIALFSVRTHRIAVAIDRLHALRDLPELGAPLRAVVRAKLAWLYAWQGKNDEWNVVAPLLDAEQLDAKYARARYDYLHSAGDRAARRANLDARTLASRGNPDLERGAAISTVIDAFFADDAHRLADGMRRLHELATNDHVLAGVLAYIAGEPGSLDFASHPRTRAYAILVRAADEAVTEQRLALLRAAIGHADESLEVEMRIAARIAFAYASPTGAETVLNEASALARRAEVAPLIEAVRFAERGDVAGAFVGIARRFPPSTRTPKLELRVLEGTVVDAAGVTIAIAERQLELLSFLALHEDGSADRDATIEAIWPDLDPAAAAHALKTAAHRIRTAIGDPNVLTLTPRGYRLSNMLRSDMHRMEEILATVSLEAVPERLGGLERSYRLFERCVQRLHDRTARWSWLQRFAPRLEGIIRKLAQAVAACAVATQRFEYAHRVAADLRTLDDADETAFAIVIQAHVGAGNRLAASREYARYVEILRSFGNEPPPAFRDALRDLA
jgi:DNA-binding SARP family transcriptional activator